MCQSSSASPAQCDCCHRHPRDAADAPPLLPAVTVTRAAVFVLLLLLRALAPVATVTAAVVYEEGENHQEGDHERDGRHAGQDQQSLKEAGKTRDHKEEHFRGTTAGTRDDYTAEGELTSHVPLN